MTLSEKIIKSHLVEGDMTPGCEIAIKIDQTLTQDATGTMAYLQFETMGIDRVKTDLSVAYIDHNMLQTSFENADDHKYIQTVANKHGIVFSRPGNGICHQVHLERFSKPGSTLLGSDSHTPTCGAMGMLAIGAGGLDVAVAMGGGAYYLRMPEIYNIVLTGKLSLGVSAKDIILELLRQLSVKGGVGKIMEYSGDGLKSLSIPERATITNMGAELGATTSIFPSDDQTLAFLRSQGREESFQYMSADDDAVYAKTIKIDLAKLEPMIACPSSPDNVKKVSEIAGLAVDQVCIGSCTNSSLADMKKVAQALNSNTVAENVSLSISPGSKQVLTSLSASLDLSSMIRAGARVLESSCGPCIGMGQSPGTDAVSLRTFNRNFEGRSGTKSAKVYLVSPETAVASSITGRLTDPREFAEFFKIDELDQPTIEDNMFIYPTTNGSSVTVEKGPNIKPFPTNYSLAPILNAHVLIKLPDNISTDHIMPSSSSLLPYRSNIPYLSSYCLSTCDPEFADRAKEHDGGVIVAGANYGQGSSREHAALVPLYLGVKAVLATSFARIHQANLINNGILPLTFDFMSDYVWIQEGDNVVIEDLYDKLDAAAMNKLIEVKVSAPDGETKNIMVKASITKRQAEILKAGGLLNYTKILW